jgi:hypothetical protein
MWEAGAWVPGGGEVETPCWSPGVSSVRVSERVEEIRSISS